MAHSKHSMEAPVGHVVGGEAGERGRGRSTQGTWAMMSTLDFILSGMGSLEEFEQLCEAQQQKTQGCYFNRPPPEGPYGGVGSASLFHVQASHCTTPAIM